MASGVGRLCSVCYQPFTDECPERVPRILNCGHTYCTECLCRLERFNSVTCPTCKRPTPTGLHRHTLFSSGHPLSSGVESLPKNFVLLDLLANISGTCTERGAAAQGTAPTAVENGTKCLEHDEVKKVYCRDDKRLICIYCQVYGEHKGHDCVLAAEAVVEQHHAIEDHLRTLRSRHDELQRAFRRIEGTAVAVRAKEIETVHTVREHFEELMAAFLQRRQALITRTKVVSAQKVKQLVRQKAAITHILTRCQNAIQGCQSALNCHDCTLFETWADLDRNVKAVLDLSCNVEPVTMSDLVCHLPREMVNHLSEHGLIRAATIETNQQMPVTAATAAAAENNTESADVRCLCEEQVAFGAQTRADGSEGDNQSLAWESAVTATAIQESLTTVTADATSSTAADEQLAEADNHSVEGSDHGTVAADHSVTHSHEESETSEQGSTVSDGDTERAVSSDNQVFEPSLEDWVFRSQNVNLGWGGARGLRLTVERDVEGWRQLMAEAQQSGESDTPEFEEEVRMSETVDLEELGAEQEEECDYETAASRPSFEEQLSHMLACAATIRNDCDLSDVVRSHQQPLIQLPSSELQEAGPSYLQHSVWGSGSHGSFELFPDPISLLFGESQNEDDEDRLREEQEDDHQDGGEYDLQHMRDHLDLIDFEQEPVALRQTSSQDQSMYHRLSRSTSHTCCANQQFHRPLSRQNHRPLSQEVPQLVSGSSAHRSQSSHSSESRSQLQCGATSSSDQDEAELMENQVNQFLGSLSTNAGAASSSDFELAPESSGSDSDTHVVAHCSLTALTAAANVTERHRRFVRMQQGRGKGIPRPWTSRRGVAFNQYFMFDRSASSQSQQNAAAAVSHEPRYLPIPLNSVCGHCPRPAKSRCCNCSRLFCDNCKRYNGIPCAHGSVEHSFTAVRRVKCKSRRPPRHAPFCNAAVQQPVHEDEEGTDSPPSSATPVPIAGSTPVRRLPHNRPVRRDARPLSHSPIRSTLAPPPRSRPRLWRCDRCTYFNDPNFEFCDACNHSRSSTQGEALTCTHCTLVNPPGSQWCEACNNQLGDQEDNELNAERDGDDFLARAL
ncbi:uncharacterized protein LOC134178065 isoform X2 [Corticium candelabrum]|uniref:uncharacterized protein LOC134178065 isoform X2 n=1 Tax=Corticium candelabrum TaxID=121492 RepID=UPI002E26D79B|nr:uncharacterized protein LOC134178065 isoform X2 [Corticium candelabrum]